MPPSTRGKLLQPRKHTPSEKIRDNLSKATKKAKVDFEYIKGSAMLGAKGVTKAAERPLTINDEEGWKKAESFVESFMREKKKDVVLTLALKYAKVCDDDDEEMDVEKSTK